MDVNLASLEWMPSRIPVRDALVAFVPDQASPPEPPYNSGETRWYPMSGGLRMVLPYDGQPISAPHFHIEKSLWDHTTCDSCRARIEAMELCYVTVRGDYVGLCLACYKNHVVVKKSALRALVWRLRHWIGMPVAA